MTRASRFALCVTGVIICAIAWWIANAIPSQPSKFDWLLSALICALLLVGFGLLGRIFGRLDSLGAYIRISVAAVSLWGILSKLVLVISTEIIPVILTWLKQQFPTWMTGIITWYQEHIHPLIFGVILPDLPSYLDEILASLLLGGALIIGLIGFAFRSLGGVVFLGAVVILSALSVGLIDPRITIAFMIWIAGLLLVISPDQPSRKMMDICALFGSIALLGVVVIYDVSPIDIVPEAFLPVVGFADDITFTAAACWLTWRNWQTLAMRWRVEV